MFFDFDGCKLYFDDWNILSMFALMYITKPFIASVFGTHTHTNYTQIHIS